MDSICIIKMGTILLLLHILDNFAECVLHVQYLDYITLKERL